MSREELDKGWEEVEAWWHKEHVEAKARWDKGMEKYYKEKFDELEYAEKSFKILDSSFVPDETKGFISNGLMGGERVNNEFYRD